MKFFRVMQTMADITGIAMKPEQYRPLIRPVNKPAVQAGAVGAVHAHIVDGPVGEPGERADAPRDEERVLRYAGSGRCAPPARGLPAGRHGEVTPAPSTTAPARYRIA